MTAISDKPLARKKGASSLFAALGFGLSGASFTLGMLLLARVLPVEAYGRFTLAIALFNIFGLLTPLGLDQLFLRGPMRAGAPLAAFLIAAGLAIGGLVGWSVHMMGGLRWAEAGLSAFAIAAGGIVATTSTGLRARHVPHAAMLLAISASFVLLLAGGIAVTLDMRDTVWPLAIFAGGNMAFAALGWMLLSRADPGPAPRSPFGRRAEAVPMLGLVALGTLSLQIERIIIPVPLDLKDLALFGVLASVAIFPFRLLASGVGFTLPPRLMGAAPDRRRGLALAEARPLIAVMIVATLGLALLGPWLADIVTGGRYSVGVALIIAGCASGAGKVAVAFPRAMLSAGGSPADLALLNLWGVAGLMLTIWGALAGARYGVAGLLWGATAGGAVTTVVMLRLAWRSLGKED